MTESFRIHVMFPLTQCLRSSVEQRWLTFFNFNYECVTILQITRGDHVDAETKGSMVVRCQLVADRCNSGDFVDWKDWSALAFEDDIEEYEDGREGCGWELLTDLPADPRLKIPKDDEFYDVMQGAATAIAKNTYIDPHRKVQVLRDIYYRLQEAKVRTNPPST